MGEPTQYINLPCLSQTSPTWEDVVPALNDRVLKGVIKVKDLINLMCQVGTWPMRNTSKQDLSYTQSQNDGDNVGRIERHDY